MRFRFKYVSSIVFKHWYFDFIYRKCFKFSYIRCLYVLEYNHFKSVLLT